MRQLTISLGSDGATLHPLVPLLTGAPFVERAWMVDWNASRPETTTVILRIVGDGEAFSAALAAADVVIEHAVTSTREGSFYAYVHSTAVEMERRLWDAFTQERSLLVPPIEYNPDGSLTCRVVGTADELRAALFDLPDEIPFTVEKVGAFSEVPLGAPGLLTDRQREVLDAAVEIGYFDVPRSATAADVAEKVGCDASTASEHLRKAQSALVLSFVGA